MCFTYPPCPLLMPQNSVISQALSPDSRIPSLLALPQVFEKSMADYLAHVRSGSRAGYASSRFIQSTFEWRDDVPDGIEVSIRV